MICRQCWDKAYYRSLGDTNKTQSEHYADILHEDMVHPVSSRDLLESQSVTDLEDIARRRLKSIFNFSGE